MKIEEIKIDGVRYEIAKGTSLAGICNECAFGDLCEDNISDLCKIIDIINGGLNVFKELEDEVDAGY